MTQFAAIIPRYVRVNTLKVNIEETIDCFRKEGWQLLDKVSTSYRSLQ
jgi:hypothetical protein